MAESVSTKLPDNIKIYKTIEEFDRNLPITVDLLHTANGSKVYVIGTAHFSLKSQDDVSLVMRNVQPDIVMLELCPLRLHILFYDEQLLLQESSEMGLRKMLTIVRTHGLSSGLFYIRFLRTNANITRQLGVAPGGECRRAVAEAIALNKDCQIILGDRLINVTLQRAARSMSLWDKLQIALMFMLHERPDNKITLDDVEQLKIKTRTEGKEEVGATAGIYNAFVTERDLVLCHSLQYAAVKRTDPISGVLKPINVVGVVGIGHSAGIVKNWGHVTTDQVRQLMVMPPERLSVRLANRSMKFGLIALCGYGVYKWMGGGKSDGKDK